MLNNEARIYLDPPLTNVKEIQLQYFFFLKSNYVNPLYLMCDLIEPKSSYTDCCKTSSETIKLKPSQVLAVIPTYQEHNSLRIPQTKNPVNHFTLWILDENGKKLNLNNQPVRIHLKVKC